MPELLNRRVVLTGRGGPEVLQLVEEPMPEPAAGEVRVRIQATGVAYADVLMRYGLYSGTPSFPFAPGYDIVGTVDKLGDGATVRQVGDTVAALIIFGGYSDFICIRESELVPVPPGLDLAEAVSLVLNYTTAQQMLFRIGRVNPGDRILVHGAAGGVGTALLQLGTMSGLRLFATASKAKHALVESLGGIPIDYKTEDFVERIRELTEDGVHLALDPVGGKNWRRSYRTLRPRGRLIGYGMSAAISAGKADKILAVKSFIELFLLNWKPDGKTAGFYSIVTTKKKEPRWFREDLHLLFHLLEKKRIQPIIAERLPLAEAAKAHKLIEEAAFIGKIVLLCGR